jgi:hypothetical protein
MQGLAECQVFVLVFTADANDSEHVGREVAKAFSLSKRSDSIQGSRSPIAHPQMRTTCATSCTIPPQRNGPWQKQQWTARWLYNPTCPRFTWRSPATSTKSAILNGRGYN